MGPAVLSGAAFYLFENVSTPKINYYKVDITVGTDMDLDNYVSAFGQGYSQ